MKNIILRNNPTLSITFKENHVEIENKEYHDENGVFNYKKIKQFEYLSDKNSLPLTAISVVLQLTGINASDFPTRPIPKISFIYEGKERSVTLNDCDMEKVNQFVNELYDRCR